MRSIFTCEIVLGITATNLSPSKEAKYASETPVLPEEASIIVVFLSIQPLQSP